MKIRIKMKTLIGLIVLTMILALIIVPIVNLRIGIYLNSKGSEKAEVFFKNYMASPIRIIEKQGLYEYGNSLVKGFDKYKITFSGWGGGENTRPEDMEKAMELFEKLLEKDEKSNYKSDYSIKAYIKLLDTSIATLDGNRLLNWIEWGKYKDNMEIKNISRLYEAYYYFVQRDYPRAEEILENYKEEAKDTKYYHLMGDINIQLGNIEKAKKYYDLSTDSDTWPNSQYFGGNPGVMTSYEIEEYLDKSLGEYKISGKVSCDGKGLPFVDIYLNKDIGTFRTGGEKPDAITDEKGEFETLGLKQGVYEIAIGINPSQLYNKVFLSKDIRSIEVNGDMKFDFDFVTPMEIKEPKDKVAIKEEDDIKITWQALKGAEYYKLESIMFSNPRERSGSYSMVSLKDQNGNDKLKENSMIFDTKSIDKRIGVLSFEGEDEIVNPTGILGSFMPIVEYPIVVKAYNKEDQLIGSSLPLRSDYEDIVSVEVKGQLTEGESLILDRKYEEAIYHYEEKLMKDPKNKNALLYLSRIYTIGWKKDKKNVSKGLKYAEEYDKLYDDFNLSLEAVNGLWGDDFKENKKAVKKILESIAEENRDTDYYYQEARYYLVEEEFEKARLSYEKMTDYESINMIYIDMYLGNYGKAIATLENGEIELMKMNTKKVIEGLNSMDKVSKGEKDFFKKTLKGILTNSFGTEEGKTLYNKIPKRISSLKLRYILEEISKEEYWDQDY